MTPARRRLLVPELLYREGRFESGLGVAYDIGTGRILDVGPPEELIGRSSVRGAGPGVGGRSGERATEGPTPRTEAVVKRTVERLPGRALLPGFVNAHSHAFQRLIRGRTQWRQPGSVADFWAWREAAYAAARTLTARDLFVVSRLCYLEMLRSGYTAVGEFHYLHRNRRGRGYADPNELALRAVAAALEVGIRIVLLNGCYAAGGPGRPPEPEQARFLTPSLEEFLAGTERLLAACSDDPLASVGVAPHSVRAVPGEWLGPLAAWAAERDLPLHTHVSEQPGEVEACLAAYGLRPVELLAEKGVPSPSFTAVHATHLSPREVKLLGEAGATVCLCPTTERDLGDGVPPAAELLEAGTALALGSDSHTVIDPFEEMRLVEYNERLRRLERVVLGSPVRSGRVEVAPRLLAFAAEGGARSLRLPAGRLEPGALADFVAVDLDHPALAGWSPEWLAPLLCFSAPADVVTDVWVGGIRRIERGRHAAAAEVLDAYRSLVRRVGDP